MLGTVFVDALPAEHEVKVWNLASRDRIGRAEISRLCESGITNVLEK